ncbi:hypothetical protein HYX58_04385 [Candidatus Dependentiae bacterium]|nr:hypothetical protein [Candidatus Dependentiae bacterium]
MKKLLILSFILQSLLVAQEGSKPEALVKKPEPSLIKIIGSDRIFERNRDNVVSAIENLKKISSSLAQFDPKTADMLVFPLTEYQINGLFGIGSRLGTEGNIEQVKNTLKMDLYRDDVNDSMFPNYIAIGQFLGIPAIIDLATDAAAQKLANQALSFLAKFKDLPSAFNRDVQHKANSLISKALE